MVLLLMTIITWNSEETSLCNKEFITSLFNNMGLVSTQQILLSIDLLIPVTSIYLVMHLGGDIMKKILYKNLKQHKDIEGLSAAVR